MSESAPPSKGDQARAEILDAARQLFISQGYHGTSMRAIAEAAGGRAVAGLYNHFPTKEAIFAALIAERNPYNTLIGVLEGALEDAATAPDYIRVALRDVLRVMPQYFDFIELAQIDHREFGGRNIRRVLIEGVFPRVFEIVAQVQALPGLRPMPPLVWLRLVASLVIGYMITQELIPAEIRDYLTPDAWADEYIAALLYGVTAPGADHPSPSSHSGA